MAITRSNNKDAPGLPTLSPDTWTALDNKLKRKQGQSDPALPLEVNVFIPVCVGYKGAITTAQIDAIATDLINRSTDDCIFKPIVFLAPRQKFPDEQEEPLDVWMRENSAMLGKHPDLQVIKSTDWRNSEKWLDAKRRHEVLLQNPGKKKVFDEFLTRDISKYASFHPGKGIEAITQHIKDDMLDCLSWMVLADDERKTSQFSVFVYQHPASEVMYHAFQHADEMGYFGGLLHVKNLKFRQKVQHQPKPDEREIDAHIRNSVANTPLESFFAGVTLGVIASGKDETDAAKYLTELYFRMTSQAQQPSALHSAESAAAQLSVPSPSYTSNGSPSRHASPQSRASGGGMFGPVTRAQRNGTVVHLSPAASMSSSPASSASVSTSATAAAGQLTSDGQSVERSVGFTVKR